MLSSLLALTAQFYWRGAWHRQLPFSYFVEWQLKHLLFPNLRRRTFRLRIASIVHIIANLRFRRKGGALRLGAPAKSSQVILRSRKNE